MADLGFEGFDGQGNYIMSEKERRKEGFSQAKIWIVLGALIGICLLITIGMSVNEMLLKINGNYKEITYSENAGSTSFVGDDGKIYYISLEDTMLGTKAGSTRVYYYGTDYQNAKVLTATSFWIEMYILWGALFAMCVIFTYKNITGKTIRARKGMNITPQVEAGYKSRFDDW